MTTAHRPTWKAAVGQANEGGWNAGGAISHQRSALDAPAHTKLKYRHFKDDDEVDKKKVLAASLLALEAEETNANIKKKLGNHIIDPKIEEQAKVRLLKHTAEVDVETIKKKYDDSDIENDDSDSNSSSSSSSESDLDDNDDDSSDDDEDDEAALQAELAKIRAEREAAKQKEQDDADAEEYAKQEAAAVFGNPLLNQDNNNNTSRTTTKRRWNDDVVFRNQAKNEPIPKKRFINDTVRNDFHKRFLNKFIR